VALAEFAAASLAKANIWSTGWAAMRAGSPAYIVPFMFIYEPALLTIGDWTTVLHAAASATLGVVLLAAGLFGYLLRPVTAWQRVLLIGAALLLIKPGWITDLIGLGLAALVVVVQLTQRPSVAQGEPR
jgi:TRAP-type uncharacterized transport system fused permease subunit